MEKFRALGISEETIQILDKKGFEEPTEIQSAVIPLILENKMDIIAQAQTGTGKTAAFALPLIERLDPSITDTQAIVLAPTRELAIQVCEEISSLKGATSLTVAPIYGGQSIELQLKKLKRGVSIVVGTPGRILDHIHRKTLQLDNIRYFVLDEADEMLNMGFIEDIEMVLDHTPEEKRVLLLSATMPDRIKKLAEKYMGEYAHIKTKTQLTTNLTDQIYFEVARKDKFEALCRIIDIESDFYGIVFCRTKIDVDELTSHLLDRGYAADALHGDISQFQREKILSKLKRKQLSVLVATDVAARGIDVDNLTHVINYSIPQDPESYVHRIGRTGRAGKEGTAITFVTPAEFQKLGFIQRVVKVDIRRQNIPRVKDITSAKRNKITEEISRMIGENDLGDYQQWADELIEQNPIDEVIAGILKYAFGKTLDESIYRDIEPLRGRKRGKTFVEEEGKTRLFIAKGKNNQMTKPKLVKYITDTAGTPQNLIQEVEIHDNFSFITVPFTEAEIILKRFRKVKNGSRTVVVKAKEKTKEKRQGKKKKKR